MPWSRLVRRCLRLLECFCSPTALPSMSRHLRGPLYSHCQSRPMNAPLVVWAWQSPPSCWVLHSDMVSLGLYGVDRGLAQPSLQQSPSQTSCFSDTAMPNRIKDDKRASLIRYIVILHLEKRICPKLTQE